MSAAARLGTVLVEAGEIGRAVDVFEPTIEEAEAAGDPVILADALARASRAYFRAGRHRDAVAAADRALEIADPMALEETIAEAFAGKAPALGDLGRWHEATAIQKAVVELASRLPSRSFESRAMNNLAAIVAEMDPAAGSRLAKRSMEVLRQTGDRVGYNWMVALIAYDLMLRGEGWDAQVALIEEALESSTLPADRGRLIVTRSLFSIARGERLDDVLPEVLETIGDLDDAEARSAIAHVTAYHALIRGDFDTAFAKGMEAAELQPQDSTGGLYLAWRAAMASADAERVAKVGQGNVGLRSGAAVDDVNRLVAFGQAALAGRREEAVAKLRDLLAIQRSYEWNLVAAEVAIDALAVLPDHPQVRAWAAEVRPLLEELRAAPYLARLDALLAAAPPSRAGREAPSTASVRAPQASRDPR